jgi:DNA-3-methyladenine glycosylase
MQEDGQSHKPARNSKPPSIAQSGTVSLPPSPPSLPAHPLPRSFFARGPRRVARDLLGKILVRQDSEKHIHLAARIVEVEAYLGENDPASHSAAGNTPRTSVLFGPPGHAYVYFIYGSHYCLNVSCEREGKAGGVLFRALEPLLGIEEMARARGVVLSHPRDLPKLTSGPGRLAQAFGITRARDNNRDLTSANSGLWIGNDDYRVKKIQITPRIGITKAADHPLRYLIADNIFVSGRSRTKTNFRPALDISR